MERVLTDFVKALRNINIRVSPAETLDAMSDAIAAEFDFTVEQAGS